MAYDLYPAVDEAYQFPPEIRQALSVSVELRNSVQPMTTTERNNLTLENVWDGRVIANTTTDHLERYDAGTTTWQQVANLSDLNAALAGATPPGVIVAYGSDQAPAGWHLCNGTAHGSQALYDVLAAGGHTTPENTPYLIDKFVLGRGGSLPKAGGVTEVLLTGGQSGVAPHAHTATAGNNLQNHKHTVPAQSVTTSPNAHSHSLTLRDGSGSGTGDYVDSNPSSDARNFSPGTISSVTHSHTVTTPAVATGDNSVPHNHAVTVADAASKDASQPHENMPPYYALTYIIKK